MKRKIRILLGFTLTAIICGTTILYYSTEKVLAQKTDNIGNLGTLPTEYNARNEFSLVQGGTNGLWRYGYSASQSNNAFTEFVTADTIPICSGQFSRWYVPNNDVVPQIAAHNLGTPCANIPTNALFIHPGQTVLGGGDPVRRAVVRWTAPASGSFQLTGSLQRQNLGATADLKIIKNAATAGESVVFSASNTATYQISYNVSVTVAAGDTLDFSVGDGGNGYNSDGSSIVINISQPPVAACLPAPANLQVNVPAENSPVDVQSVNTNASLVGDAFYTNTGKVGRAFEFDGAGDYVRIEDNAAQRPATAVTAEGWFKFDSASGIVSLISKPVRNSALNSYTLYLENGQLRGLIGNASQFTRALSNFSPQTGIWHHLAFTYDFTGGVSTLKLYANGAEVTSSVDGTANLPLSYDANPYPLLIGADFENNNPQFFLDGQADEVSIYGRALSQTEIFDIVQQDSFGKCSPVPCVQSPNNLVSWFAGEQNALDSKSNNHGTLQNGTTFQTGRVGQGIKFDGVNDYVEVPDNASLKPATLTVETWVKFDSLTSTVTGGAPTGYQNIIFKKNSRVAGSGFEGGYSLVKNPDNKLGLGFNSAGGATDFASSTTTVQAGIWYHIVGTHDGANIKFYVNGQLEGTGAATFPIDYGTTPLYLGSSQVPFSGYFNGVQDETSIYNRALSASEISSIYNAGTSGKCKPVGLNPPANQIAWFTGGGDARDFTGMNPNGVLQGNTNFRVGKVGQAFNFDGSGDYISTADSANWDFGTGDFAIESWFNSPNPAGTQRIISAGSQADGANNLWSLGYGDNGDWGGGQRLNFAVFNGGGYNDFSSNQVAFRPNTWHHAAVVRSGTSLTFYLDGVAVGTVAIGAGFAANGGTTGAIIAARYNNDAATIFEFANGKLDEISVYKRALSASEITAVYNAGIAGKSKTAAITVLPPLAAKRGLSSLQPAAVQISSATVSFANATSSGLISENPIDLALLPKLPVGATFTGLAYDISTTAGYQNGSADDVQVCFNISALNNLTFANLRIFHLENGMWINRTQISNVSPNLCSDNLTSLSPFAIVEALVPTSANVSVSGRIADVSGNAVKGVIVSLTDAQGNVINVNTNSFGRYSFGEIASGRIYVVSVNSKRYGFTPSSQVLNLQQSITDVDFTAIPLD